jgi:hypothetical protein
VNTARTDEVDKRGTVSTAATTNGLALGLGPALWRESGLIILSLTIVPTAVSDSLGMARDRVLF